MMDRFWLLTWTTYGSWLPGDARGFVSEVREADGDKVLHNQPATPYDADQPSLERYSAARMTEDGVFLNLAQAEAVAKQLRETAAQRRWRLLALAVMANHIHVLVGVPGDPDPEKLLGDFKAWCTRRLNQVWGRRDHWWTQSGSRRRKKTAAALWAALGYVRDQPHALVVWLDPDALAWIPASGAASARRCEAGFEAGSDAESDAGSDAGSNAATPESVNPTSRDTTAHEPPASENALDG
jgi:REP element-mobilizing transposase RayT